jgi:hypothetical protein
MRHHTTVLGTSTDRAEYMDGWPDPALAQVSPAHEALVEAYGGSASLSALASWAPASSERRAPPDPRNWHALPDCEHAPVPQLSCSLLSYLPPFNVFLANDHKLVGTFMNLSIGGTIGR